MPFRDFRLVPQMGTQQSAVRLSVRHKEMSQGSLCVVHITILLNICNQIQLQDNVWFTDSRRRHLSKPFYFNISYHNLKSIPSGINHLGHIYNTLCIFIELINHLIKKASNFVALITKCYFYRVSRKVVAHFMQ